MRHILLVDGDAELRLSVDRQLEETGCDVVIASTGEEAMRLLAGQIRIDVLLTALRLPDIDGRELAWAVSQKRPFVRVAYIGLQRPDEPLDPVDAPFLAKPFTLSSLAEAVTRAAPLRRSGLDRRS
jgi:two-component system, cell cycle sensor histidine kinase and response regulator CckA